MLEFRKNQARGLSFAHDLAVELSRLKILIPRHRYIENTAKRRETGVITGLTMAQLNETFQGIPARMVIQAQFRLLIGSENSKVRQ